MRLGGQMCVVMVAPSGGGEVVQVCIEDTRRGEGGFGIASYCKKEVDN